MQTELLGHDLEKPKNGGPGNNDNEMIPFKEKGKQSTATPSRVSVWRGALALNASQSSWMICRINLPADNKYRKYSNKIRKINKSWTKSKRKERVY